MANAKDIQWYKTQFAGKIAQGLAGTPFDVDMLTAIACQETGELWGHMRHDPTLTADQIVALCCGDTLDSNAGRSAFPKTKADLLAMPKGKEMFDIGRKALLDMAARVPAYKFAFNKANKFCHGYGIFQYDLQAFLVNPDYFLQRRYEIFENSLSHAVDELKVGLKKRNLQGQSAISDMQFCEVAICYNTGGFDPARGLRQGFKDDSGKYYGEYIRDYLAIARQIAGDGTIAAVSAPVEGTAIVQPGPAAAASGPVLRVETMVSNLRLRSAPKKSVPETANVIAELPDGLMVRAISGTPVNGFMEVEAVLGGRVFRGFAAVAFLVPSDEAERDAAIAAETPVAAIASMAPARLTPPLGQVTKRTAIATAHSLNETGMPGRTATDPAGLRAELARIIDYLGVDNAAHKRYQPRDGLTFCNIYAHDYCALSGVYLARVWWTQPALMKIAIGQQVQAKIGATVDEVRANDLFRWLRDFGTTFGWSRATSVTELQDHANSGGVSLIVARRKEDGRSGHIVAVVPETATESAKRDALGAVTLPLQSQAGSVNFRYNRSAPNWWLGSRFAESAFWMHG